MPPGRGTGGKKQQEQSIESREGRAFDLSPEHAQLLTQKGVFSDQIPLPSGQVAREAADEAVVKRLGPGDEAALESMAEGSDDRVNTVWEINRHRRCLHGVRKGRSCQPTTPHR